MNKDKPKTTILNSRLHRTMLSFLLAVVCVSTGHSDQRRPGISHRPAVIPPKVQEAARDSFHMALSAAADLHAGHYVLSENEAREALGEDTTNGVAEEVLAAALDAQGKDREALQQYQTVIQHYDTQPRNLLPYAQLLLKSGQWTQALALYNRVLPSLPDVGPHLEAIVVHDSDAMQASSHFSAAAPDPLGLATAIHIARGLVYNSTSGWAGDSQDTEAMAEYAKAFQLAPNNALTNYYYGIGWQKLAPAERAKFGNAAQAKAALEKAVKLGKPDVKEAAQKALLVAAKL